MPLPPRGVLEIRSGDAEHVLAAYTPLALAYFSRVPKESELATLGAMVEQGRAEAVSGGILIAIARKNAAGGIDPKVRRFFEQTMRENSATFGASAAVVLMEGFGGSLMRSFLTGLVLLSSKRKMLQIFASVDEACRWLAPHHGLDAPALIAAFHKATANIAR